MTRILVDAYLRERLLGLTEPLELCDEAGRVLAHVIPMKESCEDEPSEPRVSDEELRRREQSDEPRYTTTEVLSFLAQLERDGERND